MADKPTSGREWRKARVEGFLKLLPSGLSAYLRPVTPLALMTVLGEIPDSLWRVPEFEGLRFRYVGGLKATNVGDLLVVEPELDPQRRLVILTDGEIVTLTTAEIQAWKPRKGAP